MLIIYRCLLYILSTAFIAILLIWWVDKRPKRIRYLDFIIYWSIVLIPFSISIAPAFTYAFMGFLSSAFIIKKIIKKEKLFIKTYVNLPFIFLIFASIISFKNTIDYAVSFHGIVKLIRSAFLFLICAEEIKDKKHIFYIVLSFILGASLASFDAIWQIAFGRDFMRGRLPIINLDLRRATAAFPNANVLGVYLAPIAPLVFSLTLYYLKGKRCLWIFMTGILILVGLVLTYSRPATLAVYISLLFLGLIKKDKILTSILFISLVLMPFIIPKNIKDWAKSIKYDPIIFMCNEDRISIYKNTLNMIKHHPIIGVGINTFSKNYLKYKLPEPKNAMTGDAMYAHNNFLHMAGEIGLLGLIIFIWFLYRLFLYCARLYKNLRDDYLKILSLGLTASLVAFLINGLTETSLYYARVAMIFWFIIGFLLALKKFSNVTS